MDMAIIGHGFVGKAVDAGFNDPRINKVLIDPNYGNHVNNLAGRNIDLAFICVPTPMNDDGSLNPMAVIDTVETVKLRTNALIVIKSTITPDVIEVLTRGKGGERVVYNPEFLTERNAVEDFLNPAMHIMGGKKEQCNQLKEFYDDYSACKPAHVYQVSAKEASFIKYGINCFLASKLMWFNQFYDVVNETNDARFPAIVNAMMADPRIGNSHMSVPGFDGKRGFGGACFPKDTNAFIKFAKDFSILEDVIRSNKHIRSGYELDDREKEQNINYG